jgi:hypothetical protein
MALVQAATEGKAIQVTVYPIAKFRELVEINLTAPVYWAMELVAGIAGDRAAGFEAMGPAEELQGIVVAESLFCFQTSNLALY